MAYKLNLNNRILFLLCSTIFLVLGSSDVLAAGASLTLGTMATTITSSFKQVAKLITAGAYLGGLAFSVSAIMKFKQHKDNPTQISIGQPISLVFIAAALLFLPTILNITGNTIFGQGASSSIAGPSGKVFS